MKKTLLKRRMLLSAVLAAALALTFCISALRGPQAVPAGAWGLSFQTEGQPPSGPATQRILSGYDAAYLGNPDEKVIYLTFDAGYEAGFTAGILDTLQAHNAHAAFFVVGNYIEQEPALVQRMTDEGHIVGNHTEHHYDMSKISDPEVFRKELEDLAAQYERVTGQPLPKYYRPPQGIYSEENLRQAQALGYHTIFWSLAYVDWERDRQPTPEQAFSKLIPRVHNGCILLLHSTSETNAAILDELLTRYEALGYRFGTLDELFPEPETSEKT